MSDYEGERGRLREDTISATGSVLDPNTVDGEEIDVLVDLRNSQEYRRKTTTLYEKRLEQAEEIARDIAQSLNYETVSEL